MLSPSFLTVLFVEGVHSVSYISISFIPNYAKNYYYYNVEVFNMTIYTLRLHIFGCVRPSWAMLQTNEQMSRTALWEYIWIYRYIEGIYRFVRNVCINVMKYVHLSGI